MKTVRRQFLELLHVHREAEETPSFAYPDMLPFAQDLKAKGMSRHDATVEVISKFQGRSWRHTISPVMFGLFFSGVEKLIDYVYGKEDPK